MAMEAKGSIAAKPMSGATRMQKVSKKTIPASKKFTGFFVFKRMTM
jgi:hypothetical protein